MKSPTDPVSGADLFLSSETNFSKSVGMVERERQLIKDNANPMRVLPTTSWPSKIPTS